MPHPPQSHLEQYAGYNAAQVRLQDHSHNIHPPMIYHPPMMPSAYHESSTMDHHTSQTFQFAPAYDSLSNSRSQAQQLQPNTSSIMDRPAYENTLSAYTYSSADILHSSYQPCPTDQYRIPTTATSAAAAAGTPGNSTTDQQHASFDGNPAVVLAHPPMPSWGNPYDLSIEQRPIWPPMQWPKSGFNDPWENVGPTGRLSDI